MKAKQRLYVTADRQTVVTEGDTRAAFLLTGVGHDVPKEFVDQVKALDGGESEDVEADDDGETVDEKAAEKVGNKAVKKAANK